MKRLLPWVLLLSVAVIGASPVAVKLWERYIVVAAPYFGHAVAATTATTVVCNDTGTCTSEADAQLFEWNDSWSFSCVLATCFCLTMDMDVTIGSDTTCGDIADGNATVPDASATTGTSGPCFLVPAAGTKTIRIDRAIYGTGAIASTSRAGYRSSACSAPAAMVGAPCDEDADCPTGGSGSCSATTVPLGVRIAVEAAVAGACFAQEEI